MRAQMLVIVGLGAAALLILDALGGVYLAAGTRCGACHAMRPYKESHSKTRHASQRCGTCHANTGTLAVFADGARMARMLGGAATFRRPSPASIDERACVSCHADVLGSVIRSSGIAVRHSDFSATRCSYCHGGTAHRVEPRAYKHAEMDDCLTCHRASPTNVSSCDQCHVDDSDDAVRSAKTAWRVTHGPGWERTHGLGDLDTCAACHTRDKCAKCHGVQIPHPDGWKTTHGHGLSDRLRSGCQKCHAETWCDACHGGVPMPHPVGFIKAHYEDVERHGYETCMKCHLLTDCEACHVAGAHLKLPGISPHGRTR